jgi:hypothetical protein
MQEEGSKGRIKRALYQRNHIYEERRKEIQKGFRVGMDIW